MRIPESVKFLLVESGSWALESENTQLKESGTLLRIGIQNPSSTKVPGIRNPRCGIQNPRLSWIPLHGVTFKSA